MAQTSRTRFSTNGAIAEQLVSQGDTNSDQRLTSDEWDAVLASWFDQMDPDRTDRLTREEFLRRFEASLPARQGSRRSGGFGGSRYIGIFTALDENQDAILTRQEWTEVFKKWFTDWNADTNGALDRNALTAGLDSVMPRTNMTGARGQSSQERIPGLPTQPASPVLSPEEAIDTIHLADGFHIQLATSEPMVEDPISISFDADGRMFVLELRSYMLDMERTGERDPIARISLLEDTTGDGLPDRPGVFLDGLIVPRTISVSRGGLLYVADGKLYFAQDSDGDGQAERNELVDPDYGGGNVEHAPNGMMPAMDNWMYGGRLRFRYRWVKNTLVKQPTESRGQWGISQDNYGRLFYNVNNSQLLGDYTPPNYMGRNPNHRTSAGLNLFVSTDQRVFTRRMNTAINRGYSKDVLDPSGRAYVFASSCAPIIYRGDNFPIECVGNAFVCDPALNLIKRNLVFDDNLTLSSRFAYEDTEFLASTDERFRPVNAFNGPDGTLWIVDMYRGISQYGLFMTSYLRKETLERQLHKGVHRGRIYRIVSDRKSPAPALRLSQEDSSSLVQRLSHPNGWVRDRAQRLLLERGDRAVATDLVEVVKNSAEPLGRIHALWTLEGLFLALPLEVAEDDNKSEETIRLLAVDPDFIWDTSSVPDAVFDACLSAIGDAAPKVQATAIRVVESLSADNPARQKSFLESLDQLTDSSNEVLFQAALSAGNLSKPEAIPLLARIATGSVGHLLIREAVVSGLKDWELQFLQYLLTDPQWRHRQAGRSAMLQALASAVIKEGQPTKVELLLTLAAGETQDRSWRQRSLLEGIAANTKGRLSHRIYFRTPPSALSAISKSNDPKVAEQIEHIIPLFTWPGHPTEESAIQPEPVHRLTSAEKSALAEGKTLYQQVCAGCHGLDGEGLKPLAPPLADSEWLSGSDDRLIRIILHGLTGPVTVNGINYQPPEILPEMPPLGVLQDAQIAAVLSFARQTWGRPVNPISPERVSAIRTRTQLRETPWRQEELQPFN